MIDKIKELANKIVNEELSVRELEEFHQAKKFEIKNKIVVKRKKSE